MPDDLGATLSFDKRYRAKGNKIVFTRTRIEADEMWTFVGSKKNPVWIWIAFNPDLDEVVAFHVGGKTSDDAKKLWSKIPRNVKDNSLFFTDQLAAYNVIPEEKHVKVEGGKRVTNHVERLNCTLRQRCSRLVRKSLSFSKSLDNLISSLKYFFCCYNARCMYKNFSYCHLRFWQKK